MFAARGLQALLVTKFLPGLNAVAAALAGVVGVHAWRFLTYAVAAGLLWAGSWTGVGYFFSAAMRQLVSDAPHVGVPLVALIVAVLAAYIVYRYAKRRRFLRSLRGSGAAERGAAARPRHRSPLHLPERSDQRPGGAEASTGWDHAGSAVARWPGRMARPRIPRRTVGGQDRLIVASRGFFGDGAARRGVLGQAPAQEQPATVHARFDVRNAEPQRLRDFDG
jgi:hypothetical protein